MLLIVARYYAYMNIGFPRSTKKDSLLLRESVRIEDLDATSFFSMFNRSSDFKHSKFFKTVILFPDKSSSLIFLF